MSALDYKESVVHEAQLNKRLSIHKQRTAALKLVNKEAINIQLERIKQQQGQLDIAQNPFRSSYRLKPGLMAYYSVYLLNWGKA